MPFNGNKLRIRRIPCVVTIGTFDGVHRGHKFVLDKVVSRARKLSIKSLVVTFDSHPRIVLKKNHHSGSITTVRDKYTLIKKIGVDHILVLKTNSALLKMTAYDFLQFLQKKFFIKEFVAGSDFRFGKDAAHGAHTMEKLSQDFNFNYHVLDKKIFFGTIASSSHIRLLIQHGRVSEAGRFLGRDYMIRGKVVVGNGIGKKLGFPTVNILPGGYIFPAGGVYGGYVRLGKKVYLAAINIGNNPTVISDGNIVVEAHLLGFSGSLRGKEIELYFLQYLRKEKKFPSRSDLICAISHDVEMIEKRYEKKLIKLKSIL